jgi:hypothetical protein
MPIDKLSECEFYGYIDIPNLMYCTLRALFDDKEMFLMLDYVVDVMHCRTLEECFEVSKIYVHFEDDIAEIIEKVINEQKN